MAIEEVDSDSDGELEAHFANLEVRKAREAFDTGNFATAEQLFNNGLTRMKRSRNRHTDVAIQIGALTELIAIHKTQHNWEEAKGSILEKMNILSRNATTNSTYFLQERLNYQRFF